MSSLTRKQKEISGKGHQKSNIRKGIRDRFPPTRNNQKFQFFNLMNWTPFPNSSRRLPKSNKLELKKFSIPEHQILLIFFLIFPRFPWNPKTRKEKVRKKAGIPIWFFFLNKKRRRKKAKEEHWISNSVKRKIKSFFEIVRDWRILL